MSTHTMTTNAEGRAKFLCTAAADADCHVWADCLSTDGCESADEDCTHENVQHEHCIYSVWWSTPEEAKSMTTAGTRPTRSRSARTSSFFEAVA